MSENAFIEWLSRRFASCDPDILVGSGPDDCAHVVAASGRLGLTMDAFCEGSHFAPGTPPALIAAKAVRASLSDLAASGCRARWLLVSAGIRKGLGDGWAREFAESLAREADLFGVSVIGGDTVSTPTGLFVSVAAGGEPLPGGPVTRRGARAGDLLVVTGALGGSLRGRHLRPEPRFAEMAALLDEGRRQGRRLVTAGMDISDGLALDLSRLCRESGVGAQVDSRLVPISSDARAMAAEGTKSALAHALADGEDFELLAAVDPDGWEEFTTHDRSLPAEYDAAAFTVIGRIAGGADVTILDADGVPQPLAAEGYEHQW